MRAARAPLHTAARACNPAHPLRLAQAFQATLRDAETGRRRIGVATVTLRIGAGAQIARNHRAGTVLHCMARVPRGRNDSAPQRSVPRHAKPRIVDHPSARPSRAGLCSHRSGGLAVSLQRVDRRWQSACQRAQHRRGDAARRFRGIDDPDRDRRSGRGSCDDGDGAAHSRRVERSALTLSGTRIASSPARRGAAQRHLQCGFLRRRCCALGGGRHARRTALQERRCGCRRRDVDSDFPAIPTAHGTSRVLVAWPRAGGASFDRGKPSRETIGPHAGSWYGPARETLARHTP